jgi:D-alanyl-D-alanine carboxypeptidase
MPPSHALDPKLQKFLESLGTKKPIRHAVMAVESGDGTWRWAGGVGPANPGGPAIEANTPYFLASIDKLYNATLIMQRAEEGLIDLDAPLTAYLPATLTAGLHRWEGRDYSDHITVRHLLSHTSGLPDWLEDRPPGGESLVETVLKQGDRAYPLPEIAAQVRDRLKPHFPPQDLSRSRPKIRYSDTNYLWLIALLEAVTNQPLHEVLHERILQPLQLRHTFAAGQSTSPTPSPVPATLFHQGSPLHLPLLFSSFRGIYSTTVDSITFMRAFIGGTLFRDPATLSAMQKPWRRFGLPLDPAALRAPGWPIEYGLGLMRFQLPRVFTPWQAVPAVIGHTGSTGCWLFYCPDLDVYLSGSVDEVTAGAAPFRILPKLLRLVAAARR